MSPVELKNLDIITRKEALAMTGWSPQHFSKVICKSPVTRVGNHFLRSEFIEFFRQRTLKAISVAEQKQTKKNAEIPGKPRLIVYKKEIVDDLLKATD